MSVRLDGWVVNDGAGSVTANELGNIAQGFGLLQCDKAADAMEAHLASRNQRFERVRISFSAGGNVISFIRERNLGFTDYISRNGVHHGVAYNGLIHCNIHPFGLPEAVWVNDFMGSGFVSITPSRLMSDRRQPIW